MLVKINSVTTIIPHMIMSYYRSCCINKPVAFSHCVHLKLVHRFHALSKVCSDRDDIAPLRTTGLKEEIKVANVSALPHANSFIFSNIHYLDTILIPKLK